MAESPRRGFWKRLAREVDRGEAVSTVAARYGVNARTLGWWCSRLRRERRAAEGIELVPVVVRDGGGAELNRLEVAVGGVHLRIAVGTDVSYVASLVTALRAC